MRQLLKHSISTSIVFVILFLFSCEKKESTNNPQPYVDKCKGITCQNGGTCVEGECECIDGYEGESCEILSREKYLGTYVGYCKLISNLGFKGYYSTITIEENADETKVNIKGLIEIGSVIDVAPCTAMEHKFAFYSSNTYYYVRGNFIDGNTDKLEITWGDASGSGSRYTFKGERQ